MSSTEENETALEKIVQFAELIGYRIDGYVIPLETAPTIKIDPETKIATCPHCKATISEESEWLLVIEAASTGSCAYPVREENEKPWWNVSQGDFTRETIGYQCSTCYGWVEPADEAIW